jgi:hypothetical protein
MTLPLSFLSVDVGIALNVEGMESAEDRLPRAPAIL